MPKTLGGMRLSGLIADELRQRLHADDLRADQYLDAHSVAIVSAANVCITLATALAGGIVLLARVSANASLPSSYQVILAMAAVGTIASLVSGIFVYAGHAGVNHRAMAVFDARREILGDLLASSTEDDLGAKHLEAIPGIAEAVTSARKRYVKGVSRMGDWVAWQASLLIVSVIFALGAAIYAYTLRAF